MAYTVPKTRAEIEAALDSCRLFVAMDRGAWWQLRRNGTTRVWARQPGSYRIPCKVGFRGFVQITQDYPTGLLRVADTREQAEGRE